VEFQVDLSFVIPVYNGGRTIGGLVERIHELYGGVSSPLHIEVILINDGSADDSERSCLALVEKFPDTVRFLHLARNFGEHNAVMAGLNASVGAHAAVLDDDGQNPPEEVQRMYDALLEGGFDTVYGRFRVKQHDGLRNFASWINDRMANWLLHKPRGLYLSSFKVMNRFVVDEITKYGGAFPYIDGLILRATRNLGQIEVEHLEREDSASNYTPAKLIRLWLNMFMNFSILPLRIAALAGLATSLTSLILMLSIVVEKIWFNPEIPLGLPTILISIFFFGGVQLVILGLVGEYLGRLFQDHSRTPQFVIRYSAGGTKGVDG
jgi:undecaprenyl-phosphate 4-deoxy-4-formamido-L-arabinose transferase